ncbi:uncharacterized protein DDB_G0271670 [Tetranychus urticae]|uniref:uncharacterized protein DDB_G0271670 n=1 Tax=Tetranychus urticae TaxID=32264 RepID=UPI00077BDCBF|nr:uncharacterized protein DDB_G0271670 [Tetranychus urticae]
MAVASGHEADNVYFEDDEEEEEYDDDEVEDDDDDDDDESCSDQSSTTSTSTSNNQRVDGGRVCDCCYCEVFGHGMPAVAPTSRNYNEMRERLRSRLNKRKAERGRCENRSNVSAIGNDKRKEVVGKEDNRDLEELLNYIEGTTNRDANKPGKTKKKKEKQKKKKEKQKDKKSSSSLNIMNSSVDSETSNPNQADSKTNVLKCNLSEPTSDKVNNHKDNYSNASKEDKSTQAIFDLSTPSGSHNLSPHVERTKERKHSNQIDHNSYRNTSATIASDHKVACNHSISSSNIKKTKEEKRRNGDETKSDKNQIIHTEFASTDSHEGQQATHQISQERHNHVRCSSSTPTSLVNHERSPSHCSINVSNSTNNSSTSRTTTSISKVASSTSTTLYPSRTPSSPPPLAPSIATTAKLETTSKSSLTLSLTTSASSSTTTTTISSSPSRSSSSSATKTSSSTTSNDISDHCVNPSTTVSFRSKNGQKFSQSSGINNASNKKPHQDRLKESIPSSDKRNCLNLATHNSPHQLIEETLSSTPKNSKRRDKRENKSRNKNISDDILSPDEVFRPKDIDLENDELDETEKEIEAFKRFCYNSVPLARKDKVNVHVNLKDILFKRSPISGNLEIKHSVKNEPGK